MCINPGHKGLDRGYITAVSIFLDLIPAINQDGNCEKHNEDDHNIVE